jgi:hypothetical protein
VATEVFILKEDVISGAGVTAVEASYMGLCLFIDHTRRSDTYTILEMTKINLSNGLNQLMPIINQ